MGFEHVISLGLDESRFYSAIWNEVQKMGKHFEVTQTLTDEQQKNADCLLLPLNGALSREMIDRMPNLKYVGVNATGFDKIDIAYAREKGVIVTNIPGYSTNAVAEFVFGTTLEHLRELSRAKKQAKEGDFSEASFNGSEISDKTFGIIGLGQIGQKTGKIAKGFNCNVIYWSRNRKPEMEKIGITYSKFEDVLSQSDFLSFHLE